MNPGLQIQTYLLLVLVVNTQQNNKRLTKLCLMDLKLYSNVKDENMQLLKINK